MRLRCLDWPQRCTRAVNLVRPRPCRNVGFRDLPDNTRLHAVLQPDIASVVRVKGLRDGSLLAVRTDNLLWVRRAGVGANGTFVPVVGSCCIVDVDELPDGRLLAIGPNGNMSTSTLTMYNTLTAPWAPVGGPAAGNVTVTAIATYSGSERLDHQHCTWSCVPLALHLVQLA
jgi:hypothetical protein